jgi:hypothetical protein
VPIAQPDKPLKKKEKEKKHKTTETEGVSDANFQPHHDAAEEVQSEKKKKRKKQKYSKPSSFSDDSRADESKPDEGDGSSPKRQKTIVEDHVQVG